MKRVAIISPLSGEFERNTFYAELALLDCVFRGEAPYASHLLMPRVLDDKSVEERRLGMAVGEAWIVKADLAACYMDLGSSSGMADDLKCVKRAGVPTDLRRLVEETAIPDERLIDIWDPIRRNARNPSAQMKKKLLEQLFPRIFDDDY